MKALLIANTIFEFGLALLLLLRPEVLGEGTPVTLARVLSGNALGLGTLSLIVALSASREPRPALIALGVFHTAVAVAHIVNLTQGTVSVAPAIAAHGVFATLFWLNVVRTSRTSATLTA